MINEQGYIGDSYKNFIHQSRYARYLPDKKRRETWVETVDRYTSYFSKRMDGIPDYMNTLKELNSAIKNHEVMPSMRAMATAGKALERDNVAGFNCSYLTISRQKAFDELMYILLCGTGVGFSVERQYICNLPTVAEEMYDSATTIMVHDSKIGWASAFRELISLLYSGKVPQWDMSKVRPKGSVLKTFGGRASGPEPLDELFNYTVNLFKSSIGRKLNSIECHGLVCKIAEIVVVGGVRRSALISLSNLTDQRMAHAKSGQWWVDNPEYSLANNSIAFTEKPDEESFMRFWINLVESKSGERGIFNRVASEKAAQRNGRRDDYADFGTNPCSEIILRDRQFCNLSEVIVRSSDSLDSLKQKVRIATILGTLQATLTNFRYLGKKWENNTKEEALLGVSLTGIMDHPVMSGSVSYMHNEDHETVYLSDWLNELKEVAIETNKDWSTKLGINQSVSITAVKPSGTVSQLVNSASGIHPRFSPYYIRTVRADNKDPLAIAMSEAGFPCEPDVMKPDSTLVFSFPMKAPSHAVFVKDVSAIQQLEHWLVYQRNWCEHKPSVTIYVKNGEWMQVGAWVYEHFDELSGVSFLPYTDHTYKQAPYQEITEDKYNELVEAMPKDTNLVLNEEEDNTEVAQTLACTGGSCEI